ncbi:MAG: excisionase family DNA-binding protein, partial [Chloroflexota bacterium]|nr:excisionase family DNA-binding protein [Chloroflexota bacterium]
MAEAIGPGEAARRLGVSTRTVQRWLRQGRLRAVPVGGRLKVDAEGLESDASAASGRGLAPIRRLLVANRGELVPRIAATCRRLGIRSLALATGDERDAWWATQADEIVPLTTSYLDSDSIVSVALETRSDAVHPGYGFLAESADFAEAVIAAGLVWVGPPPGAMRALGDKAAARRLAARLGVPILPGYEGAG